MFMHINTHKQNLKTLFLWIVMFMSDKAITGEEDMLKFNSGWTV